MQFFMNLSNVISDINILIEQAVISGGIWAYALMFIMIYIGTAFVFAAPVLPSVSLIFLVTSLAAAGMVNPYISYLIFVFAIFLGDLTAYYTGQFTHSKLMETKLLRLIKAEHINKTKAIYDKSDFLTFIFARFTPIIGSLAQFVAGTVQCGIKAFILKNVAAGIIWLTFQYAAGWIFAIIPAFKENFVLAFFLIPIFSGAIGILYYIARNMEDVVYIRQWFNSLFYKGDEA